MSSTAQCDFSQRSAETQNLLAQERLRHIEKAWPVKLVLAVGLLCVLYVVFFSSGINPSHFTYGQSTAFVFGMAISAVVLCVGALLFISQEKKAIRIEIMRLEKNIRENKNTIDAVKYYKK